MQKNSKADSESAGDSSTYAKNELVLCYHQTSLYEAKVLNVDFSGHKDKPYFVHYNGWNSRWDEWVPADRIVRMNEDGLAKKRDLDNAKKTGKQSSKKSTKRDSNESEDAQSKDGGGSSRKHNSSSALQAPSGALFGVDDANETSSTKPSSVVDEDEETQSVSSSAKQSKGGSKKARMSVAKTDKQNEKSDELDKSGSADKSKARNRKSTDSISKDSKEKEKDKDKLRTVSLSAQSTAPETKPTIDVRLTDTLKCWLVDDTDLVTRLQKLTIVPARISVREILNRYVEYVRLNWNTPACRSELFYDSELPTALGERVLLSQVREFARGIVVFFNTVLGKQLLFKFERPQYDKILSTYGEAAIEAAGVTASTQSRSTASGQNQSESKSKRGANNGKENETNQQSNGSQNKRELADAYGCAHLIRLLSKLGPLLSASPFNATELAMLQTYCQHFISWLTAQLERGEIGNLQTDYCVPPPEYQRHACC